MTCPKCSYKSEFHFRVCPECTYDVLEGKFQDLAKASAKGLAAKPDLVSTIAGAMTKRYPALRTMSAIYKALAYICAAAGVIAAVVGILTLSQYMVDAFLVLVGLLAVLYGAILCITFLAISEGIHVFVDIESNARVSNALLEKLLQERKSPNEG